MKNSASSTLNLLPGLGIAAAIAVVATLIGRYLPILGSAMPAIVIGVLMAIFVRRPASWGPGLKFASKMVLQVAVVVLGTQLSLRQVAEVGVESFPVMISGMWPLLVSKLRGLGVSLGLPLACPSFSGPESFFGGWGSAPFLGSLWCWLFLVFGYESPGGFPVVAPVL